MDVVSDIYVVLREGKFSVGVMASRVAESINDGASFVILDTRNKVLPGRLRGDSHEGILGRDIKACQEDLYESFNESSRASKKRRVSSLPSAAAAISADLAVVEERVRSLVESTALTAVVLLLPPNQARPLVGALSCAISKGPISQPLVSVCCALLLGCKACTDECWLTSDLRRRRRAPGDRGQRARTTFSSSYDPCMTSSLD
ncbi:hypothetical protein CAPTEDRAFT_198781 [Capitella teleta]|uniref:Uncharacterized protein n=1 Tax=Capitella teleta TaxID=283909 RepID=R7TDF5_CAPTE|nr:hypothetical protein CAPTEDRAFT_198781 [Capitella teleta]|eukprot:ELT91754.1 hypothetical protein CAPTEDRAFT_198781 [Capitella teleta]